MKLNQQLPGSTGICQCKIRRVGLVFYHQSQLWPMCGWQIWAENQFRLVALGPAFGHCWAMESTQVMASLIMTLASQHVGFRSLLSQNIVANWDVLVSSIYKCQLNSELGLEQWLHKAFVFLTFSIETTGRKGGDRGGRAGRPAETAGQHQKEKERHIFIRIWVRTECL